MPVQEMHEQRYDAEKEVKRNPHADFNQVQASRPAFDSAKQWEYRQPPKPKWKLGDGANDGGECLKKEHIAIDPYEEGRPAVFNYKLMISAIVPRPIGFVSTLSKDGENSNLAPFSYTQMGMLGLLGLVSESKGRQLGLTPLQLITIRRYSLLGLQAVRTTRRIH